MCELFLNAISLLVSPTSILSRILKARSAAQAALDAAKVSPTSIRSRILKGNVEEIDALPATGFTHVDPFEYTKRETGALLEGY